MVTFSGNISILNLIVLKVASVMAMMFWGKKKLNGNLRSKIIKKGTFKRTTETEFKGGLFILDLIYVTVMNSMIMKPITSLRRVFYVLFNTVVL